MDENQNGTPNPLNPSPEVDNPAPKSSIPVTEPLQSAPVSEPTLDEPVTAKPDVAPVEPVTDAPASNEAPTATEPVVEAPKKKKTGLIIGMIACLFIAAGCGVAALLFFMNNNGDPVKAAISKIISGDMPSNIVASGVIEAVAADDADVPFSKLSVNLKTELVPKFDANTASADVKLSLSDGTDVSLKVDEVHTSDGDLYLKVDGIKNILNSLMPVRNTSLQANCMNDSDAIGSNCIEPPVTELPYEPIDCASEDGCLLDDELDADILPFAGISGIIELLDGEWIKISEDDLSQLTEGIGTESSVSCLTNLIDDLSGYGKTMAEIYNKNPFVTSTNEKLAITSKRNPLFKLGIEKSKLEGFVNEVQTTKPIANLFSCMGYEDATVDFDELTEGFEDLPAVYAEVDGNSDFTRFYLDGQNEAYDVAVTADFDLSYPASINVTEPAEYKDLMTLLQSLMSVNNTL